MRQISHIQRMPGVGINVKKVVSEISSYEKHHGFGKFSGEKIHAEKEILKGVR